MENYTEQIKKELAVARRARVTGNEGRARVCARRAVKIALSEYVRFKNEHIPSQDAIELMKYCLQDESLPGSVRDSLTNLSSKITPDFRYSASSDVLTDAEHVIEFVMKEIE